MRRLTIMLALLAAISIALTSSTAFANGDDSSEPTQFIDISALEIDGSPHTLGHQITIYVERPAFIRLLAMQTSFVDRVVESAEEL